MEKQCGSRKILLFLSVYNPQNPKTAAEIDYQCPDGSTVPGRQTNEALCSTC